MEDEKWVAIGVLIFFSMLFVLMIISMLKTGRENPTALEKVYVTGAFFCLVRTCTYMGR